MKCKNIINSKIGDEIILIIGIEIGDDKFFIDPQPWRQSKCVAGNLAI
jgi:hypothetical protein